MSSSYNSFSTPALRRFVHNETTVDTSISTLITPPELPARRVMVIIQNKSLTDPIEVIYNDTDSTGLIVMPLQTVSVDNYNGTVRAKCNGTSALVHFAYAQV